MTPAESVERARREGRIGANTWIAKGVEIGTNVRIGANARIEPGVRIAEDVLVGANTRIAENVLVATGVELGTNARIGANARIAENVQIGAYALIAPTAWIERGEYLHGLGMHVWDAYRVGKTRTPTLRYGCVTLPLADWTSEQQRHECAARDPRAREDLARIVRTTRTFFCGKAKKKQ